MKQEGKIIEIELVYDIPYLIRIQEASLREMKKRCPYGQHVIDFQEDILRILKAVNKMDSISLDMN